LKETAVRKFLACLAIPCAALLMGGCELECKSEPKGPAENVGEAIDKAVDELKSTEGDDVKITITEKDKP